jgi:hypothetical protein
MRLDKLRPPASAARVFVFPARRLGREFPPITDELWRFATSPPLRNDGNWRAHRP